MIPGWVLLGKLPLAALPDEESLAQVSPEARFLGDPDAELVFLLELTPTGGSMLRLSDVGYITAASDSPASTPYPDRLLSAYNLDTRIPPPDAATALGELAFGVIELEDGDEAIDSFLAASSEGCAARVKVGGRYHVNRATQGALTFAQFPTVQRATVAAVGWEEGRIVLTLRERLRQLSDPLQANVYEGTGGLEGPDTLAGQRKPWYLGRVLNVEPVLLVESTLIYQWSDGAVEAVLELRDRGVALTSDGDVADIEAAAQPAGGHYITQNSGGYLRLGGVPAGRLTLDGKGDKTGGVYVSEPRDIAKRMAERVGLTAADFDAGSFAGFPLVGEAGIGWRDGAPTALEAIGRLLAGVFGWVSQSREGLLRVGRFNNPAAAQPEATITDDLISSLEEGSDRPPVWAVEVEYGQNQTQQDADGLSEALPAELRRLYSEPYAGLGIAVAPGIKTANVDARVVRFSSALVHKTDADALAADILEVLGRRVRNYVLAVERQLFLRQPNAVLRIESSASDLAGGRNLLLLAVGEDAPSRGNRWELWG